MDGEVNNPTARITQDVKRDVPDRTQHETTRDGRRQTQQTQETEADETTQTNTDRRTHNTTHLKELGETKKGKGLRRVRGKGEGNELTSRRGEVKRRD